MRDPLAPLAFGMACFAMAKGFLSEDKLGTTTYYVVLGVGFFVYGFYLAVEQW